MQFNSRKFLVRPSPAVKRVLDQPRTRSCRRDRELANRRRVIDNLALVQCKWKSSRTSERTPLEKYARTDSRKWIGWPTNSNGGDLLFCPGSTRPHLLTHIRCDGDTFSNYTNLLQLKAAGLAWKACLWVLVSFRHVVQKVETICSTEIWYRANSLKLQVTNVNRSSEIRQWRIWQDSK